MAAQFTNNPNYMLYEKLLVDLAKLMANGKGDSEEAESVRDHMDAPYSELTKEEAERLDLLSADLYMVEGEELLLPVDRTDERFNKDIMFGVMQEFWEYSLVLLRKRPVNFSPKIAAYSRARAYEGLGHLDASIAFTEFLLQLEPGDVASTYFFMERLRAAGRVDQAVSEAEKYIDDPLAAPELRIEAGMIFFDTTRGITEEEAQPTYRRIVSAVDSSIKGLAASGIPLSGHLPSILRAGWLVLGMSCEGLSEEAAALRAYDEAVKLDPRDDAALTARGALLFPSDRKQAMADFEVVVADGSPLAAPYFYLAYDAVTSERYKQCVEFCEQVLARKSSTHRVRATATSWIAIAHYSLGWSTDLVRQEFQAATLLDPENPFIKKNLEVFERLEARVLTSAKQDVSLSVPVPMPMDVARTASTDEMIWELDNPSNYQELKLQFTTRFAQPNYMRAA